MRVPDQQVPYQQVVDAPKDNWVDRYAPAATRPYLRLSRADRPIGTWLLLIPCWWGLALAVAADPAGPGWFDLWIALGCGVGAFVMRGAGCTWNDITDRDIDAQVARTRSRPLPSGQVSVRQALVWMVLQALIGAAILLTFPPMAILLGVASLVPVAIYPFAKRFTWWPQAFLGIAFNWGALVAWAAQSNDLSLPAVLLWLAGLIWTLFYDTIYAHQDKEDDELIGVKSTARLFGDADTPLWLRRFLVGTLVFLALAVVKALIDGPVLPLVIALAGIWAFGWHLRWQLMRLDTTDTTNCLKLFRSNRDAGLILALFLAGAAMV
nr:4-hydroxybenzoate octaprenyltransferase [Gemmobacter serpentinus]